MEVMILGRRELRQVLEMSSVIEGVKTAYLLKAQGETAVWPLVSHEFEKQKAVMDIRSGGIFGSENLHGLKMLNNFPLNREKGLPSFNGMLMIFDSETGVPLGVMDASYITCMRTGAAGAVGAQLLARPDAKTLFILGAGKQALFQLAASVIALPRIKQVYIADPLDVKHAENFAALCPQRLKEEFGLNCGNIVFEAVPSAAEAVSCSDIVITVTPARKPVIQKEWVRPGTHFSCIGADMEGKEEIDPHLFSGARVFADDLGQCARVGEMELAIKSGLFSETAAVGEIGQVLLGEIAGRRSGEEITIFDATGLAALDLVTGKRAVDLARVKGIGMTAEI